MARAATPRVGKKQASEPIWEVFIGLVPAVRLDLMIKKFKLEKGGIMRNLEWTDFANVGVSSFLSFFLALGSIRGVSECIQSLRKVHPSLLVFLKSLSAPNLAMFFV